MHPAPIHPRPLGQGAHLSQLERRKQVSHQFVFDLGALPDAETVPDAFPAEERAPLASHELPVRSQHGSAPGRQHLEQTSDQENPGSSATVALMGQDRPGEWAHRAPEERAQHQDVQRGLAVVSGGAVHDQGELAVGRQGKQDVCGVLLSELSVVEDPGDRPGL